VFYTHCLSGPPISYVSNGLKKGDEHPACTLPAPFTFTHNSCRSETKVAFGLLPYGRFIAISSASCCYIRLLSSSLLVISPSICILLYFPYRSQLALYTVNKHLILEAWSPASVDCTKHDVFFVNVSELCRVHVIVTGIVLHFIA